MLTLIYQFYKQNLSHQSLVFKYMPWVNRLMFVSVVIVVTSMIISGIYANAIPMLLSSMFFIPSVWIFNYYAKKVVKQRYNIVAQGFLWCGPEYEVMRINLLKQYLKKEKLLTESKIKLLVDLFYKESESKKFSGFLTAGVFLALFVPLWSQFLGWIYQEAKNFEQVVEVTLVFLFVIVMIIIALEMTKRTALDIFNTKSQSLKNLARMLEETLVTL